MANVRFLSQGSYCQAWLDLPNTTVQTSWPLVILGHGFSGTKDVALDKFAARFRQAGYATLVFDYRNFGDSEGAVRQHMNPWHEIADWHAALAFARTQPMIDSQRIVLWGTSFAGGLVLSVAAQDQQVAATISQCPMLDGLASTLAVLNYAGVAYSAKMMGHGVRDVVHSLTGQAPHYIPVIGQVGELAAMSSAGSYEGFKRLVPANSLWRNQVTARTVLYLSFYRPIKQVALVKCPALYVICQQDTVAPAAVAYKAAKKTTKSQVVSINCGHFDIYDGELFEQSVAAQVKFLTATVPV